MRPSYMIDDGSFGGRGKQGPGKGTVGLVAAPPAIASSSVGERARIWQASVGLVVLDMAYLLRLGLVGVG
jgi:hypothetical protein